jgi:hypothetical protein
VEAVRLEIKQLVFGGRRERPWEIAARSFVEIPVSIFMAGI